MLPFPSSVRLKAGSSVMARWKDRRCRLDAEENELVVWDPTSRVSAASLMASAASAAGGGAPASLERFPLELAVVQPVAGQKNRVDLYCRPTSEGSSSLPPRALPPKAQPTCRLQFHSTAEYLQAMALLWQCTLDNP